MSRILDAIGRLLPARAPRRDEKASATGALIALESLGQPVWSPRNYEAFAREGFMQNAIVYRCVRMIAEAAASVPLLAYEGGEEIDDHPLLELIAQPSPDHTGTDFLESWYGFLLVAGNAYVEAVAVSGRLRELYVLRPDRMQVIPGPNGWPEAFEYSANGSRVRFAAEPVAGVRPILHTRLFHPDNDHYGMSPIEAAAVAVDIHNETSAWNKALLDNSARPSGALVYGAKNGNLTGEQFKRLRAELEAAFQGARNAGRPMLLEGGLDWKPLSLSPKDMDFIAAKNAAARDIALALGVPPMLLGIPGDNTYSNYSEAQRAFWRGTVLPLVNRMAKGFSAWLSPAYGGGVELKPDLDQVEGLSAERDALWARIERASFLTQDEKRAAVGYGVGSSLAARDSPARSRPRAAGGTAPFGGEAALFSGAGDSAARSWPPAHFVKYNPDQSRVPAGNSDGGQWTAAGGGIGLGSSGSNSSGRSPGRVQVALAGTGTLNDAGETERLVHLAQAVAPRSVRTPVLARFPTATPAEEARLAIAEADAFDMQQQVRTHDPNWRPTPSLSSTIEGAISAAEAEAREAHAHLREMQREPLSSRPLDEVCRPGGVSVGNPTGNPGVAVMGRREFDGLLMGLARGAKEITPAETYQGLWYRRPDGTVFGLRRSKKYGLTIDIIDSTGNPQVRPGQRFHIND